MSNNLIPSIGFDDGHDELKIKYSNGKKLRIPSHVMSGKLNIISVDNNNIETVFSYETPEGFFTCGEIPNHEPTNFNDYPISAQNRVLVAHGLYLSELESGSSVNLCTGLPLKKYYIGGKPNSKLIKSKIDNLTKNNVKHLNGFNAIKIEKHIVSSEGVAAWVDAVVKRNNSGQLYYDKEELSKRIAIIDWGGRTLDLAVMKDWKLDDERSDTFDIGMLSLKSDIRNYIYQEFEVDMTDEQMKDALQYRKIKLFGKYEDINDIILESEKKLVNKAFTQISKLLGKASDIDEIRFVGGTSAFLEPHLKNWFRQQIFVEDPGFSNASGFQKLAELTFNK